MREQELLLVVKLVEALELSLDAVDVLVAELLFFMTLAHVEEVVDFDARLVTHQLEFV